MSFLYPGGTAGITIGGHDLSEFSAKLLSSYTMGACGVEGATFQGRNRSSLLLLDQRFSPMEIVLPLEFWGLNRQDTVAKWTSFCQAASGSVILDLGDGYEYACTLQDLGKPAFISDGYLTVDVTFLGFRQKPEVVISTETEIGATITCDSTFPRTDCIVTMPQALLRGASRVSLELGDNSWYLAREFTANEDLVLDGVNKIFLLGGKNVTGEMTWEDFPYLTPGENHVGIYINTIGVTRGVEIRYRPTYL